MTFFLMIVFLLIFGFFSYSNHQSSVQLEAAFKNDDKIQVLYHLLASESYAKDIRQAGFTIPPDSAIRFDGAIDPLEIEGDLHLKISPPGEKSTEIWLFFSTEIDGQEMDAVYTLDDKLQLQDSNYYQLNGEGTNERVNISESEEKRLLSIVQKEINGFLDTMEETLYNQ